MFKPWLNKGYDIRPTIAVTRAHIDLPEVKEAVRAGRLAPDGNILSKDGQAFITKVRQKADLPLLFSLPLLLPQGFRLLGTCLAFGTRAIISAEIHET